MMYVDNPFESPVVLSFCPGILGIERGLERAGVKCRVAAYVEIEAFICANLVAGMEAGFLDPAPIWTDAKTFDAKPFRGKIHGIIGGYPCQPFSMAGNRKGKEDPRHLWPYILSAFRATKPFWGFFENVSAHLSKGYIQVRHDLEKLGYRVEEGIFSAEEVGAPHKRERLFFLALANAYGNDSRRFSGNIFGESGQIERKKQRENGEWSRDEYRNGGSKVADSNGCRSGTGNEFTGRETRTDIKGSCERSELVNPDFGRCEKSGQSEQGKKAFAGNNIPGKKVADPDLERGQLQVEWKLSTEQFTRWPCPQGNYQWEWEEPRTIEPGVGCTVNGYNFRNDFLRALGNSVVEQTAELAFITLLKKQFTNSPQ